MAQPDVAGDLEVIETDDGVVVYQESRDRVHHLNHTAAVILHLCDGQRDPEEIARLVADLFSLDDPPLIETRECLDDLAREGLVQ